MAVILILCQSFAIFVLISELWDKDRALLQLRRQLANAATSLRDSPPQRAADPTRALTQEKPMRRPLLVPPQVASPIQRSRRILPAINGDPSLALALAQEKGRRWGPEQATGAPDTTVHDDLPTAWAALEPSAGPEWLELDYRSEVEVAEVRVHESYNPGAISKVSAVDGNGVEQVMWKGTMPLNRRGRQNVARIEPSGSVRSMRLRIYLDTQRVQGWNEIDAVELIGRNGSRQWATAGRASSTYANLVDK